ncbi:MAG: peptide chain release factor N(5)-glutamine methyltransferase [Gammaproteobacteria bacterium]|jgi:release factor glutamine methyltransferase|nr:peptide chain release factor N(5)-glutamine methyltransferase [Gammaproteobacteria bacterium]MDH3953073.1 peptide chain release factor N(5)-glutamine methyltransferase [Gammaproteobacteria bacterium]
MNDLVTIHAVLEDATRRLGALSDSPRLDAELLLARVIDVPRSYLFAHPEEPLDAHTVDRFRAVLDRRLAGEPMAYITGIREFWSLELMVTPATLVPRPETELLVDLALREIPRRADWGILDLGTGSGAIAIAIAKERPLSRVTATDVSAEALEVARQNARQLEIPNIEFLSGDWTGPVQGRTFNVVVSNPPYVRSDDEALDALHCEPRSALSAGEDGLDAIRILARDCRALLEPGGVLLIEHGAEQRDGVAAALREHDWSDVTCHTDYAGLPRVTVARTG